MAISRESYI